MTIRYLVTAGTNVQVSTCIGWSNYWFVKRRLSLKSIAMQTYGYCWQYCTAHTCHQLAYIFKPWRQSTYGQMMFHFVCVQKLCTVLELTLDKLHV